MIETMVAALLLAIGGMATLQVLDVSARTTFRSEQSQVVANQLQRELEKMRTIGYEELAMTRLPAPSGDATDPRHRIAGGAFAVNRDGTRVAEMVVADAGRVDPGPERFTSGDVSGEIHRFVVWQNNDACDPALCPGTHDFKRLIVAARVDTASVGPRSYQELHSTVTDPDAARDASISPPAPDSLEAQELWLTDTGCDKDGREPIAGSHVTHNTLGECDAGTSGGALPGAPDLLVPEAPPLDPAFPSDEQPLFDLAGDLEPLSGADEDRGLQLNAQAAPGCDFSPSEPAGTAEPHQQTHRWVTAPMPGDPAFTFVLEGTATLELWTQTINGAVHPGRICVHLFSRETNVHGETVDVPIADATTFAESRWPIGAWGRVTVPVSFPLTRIGPGERLGLALSVERGGTGADALQFLYDHPDFDSRLELETVTPLP
jgi:hypothetical protein